MAEKIKIDKEFQQLIPKLTKEEYKGLEENIVKEGCRDALILWNDILIDGHNRYVICQKHGIKWQTTQIKFKDRNEAKEWIILNQFNRRNLSAYDRSLLALKLENYYKEKGKENLKRAGKGLPTLAKVNTREELAKNAGVAHGTIDKVRIIEEKAPEEIKEKIRQGKESINKVYTLIKQEERRQLIQKKIQKAELTSDKYRIIYADPPWFYGNDYTQAMPGSTRPEDHYPAMRIQEICNMHIKEISEDNAVLFLWVTSPLLEDAFKVIKEWGFQYKTSFVWDKIKHNFGYYNSVRHEFLLVCTRGSCLPDIKTLHDSVVSIERTKHSEKPNYFRDLIDKMYTVGKRIELFARTKQDNWDNYGNQLQ